MNVNKLIEFLNKRANDIETEIKIENNDKLISYRCGQLNIIENILYKIEELSND